MPGTVDQGQNLEVADARAVGVVDDPPLGGQVQAAGHPGLVGRHFGAVNRVSWVAWKR
ncbi:MULTISPECIES: hypothetical protein [Streptomyces]|uniref:hypothetical protein n=1 Tax=Streptomyces TaxID=1883 RepID=UPI00130079BA|nr:MULTISPECIES: hypothetical protein [Streptomyces]WSQ40141.1 hypothetical protein OG609_41045 [Streptomyces sp. NBC_01224]